MYVFTDLFDDLVPPHAQISTNAVFKPYDLLYKPDDEHAEVINIPSGKRRTHNITNLTPSTKYEIKVSAYTDDAEGDASVILEFTSPAQVEGTVIVHYYV